MVSTRQSSNSNTNIDGSTFVELSKNFEAGPSGTTKRNQQQASLSSNISISQSLDESSSYINLLDLPLEILQKILGYLNYNTVAHLRPTCHQMDKVCGSILNSTFQRLQSQMLNRFQAIKAQMPRRESARRNHPLACESDIIETLHMRLTLLQMSFGKHIERKHCCFFPGEILDEVYRILHYIKVTPKLARPYKVTDELFDLSTMAMEYFKDSIEPMLPEIPYFGAEFLDLTGTFSSPLSVSEGKTRCSGGEGSPSHCSGNDETCESSLDINLVAPTSPPQSNMVLRKRIKKIKQGMRRYNSQLTLMRRDLRSCKHKIAEQQKQIIEYATRLDENDKKNEETSRKFSTLLQELNKCKTEMQYWRSKSPAIPVCFGCGQSIPVPTEDLQVLANQGVSPKDSENSINGSFDFIPIADVEMRSPIERDNDAMLGFEYVQQPQPSSSSGSDNCNTSTSTVSNTNSNASNSTCSSTNNSSCCNSNSSCRTSLVKPMAPPNISLSIFPDQMTSLPLISSKRKSYLTNAEEAKKPRRALKARQVKRSKI